ncbi:hypothetical protein TNCT_136241 [Trichonephila clavata]|uniref:Uncharacterized protein n=1 Tax=Trichonephila clavata TaxID=2740835 RepID=A0A8X6GT16_TRICU|nr:hypothetical protein TNCT_136241 [Trichonephila clavata]
MVEDYCIPQFDSDTWHDSSLDAVQETQSSKNNYWAFNGYITVYKAYYDPKETKNNTQMPNCCDSNNVHISICDVANFSWKRSRVFKNQAIASGTCIQPERE